MTKNDYIIKEMTPPVDVFNSLRESVGWKRIDNETVEKGLNNSLYSLCMFHDNEIIGICRLVGDGALKIYVEELIIHPVYQHKGLGTKLMNRIMSFIKMNYKKGCKIGLFANKNLEQFYNKFGFNKRKDDMPGMDINL